MVSAFGLFVESLSISSILLSALAFLVLSAIAFYVWYNYRYRYVCGIYHEKGNGAVIYQPTGARMFKDDGLSVFSTWVFSNRKEPAPSLDTIYPSTTGKAYFEMWLDAAANFHQVRKTKFVPVLLSDDGGVLSQAYREFTLADGSVRKVGLEEVIFEPDSRSNRAWAWNSLRRNNDKHKNLKWYQDKAMIIIMTIALVGIMVLVFAGYYFTEIQANTAENIGRMVNPLVDKLSKTLTLVGG